MFFINILNDFCKETKIFIDFSLTKTEYYDESNNKQIIEIVSENDFNNHVSIVGMHMVLDYYAKNEIIFAIIQRLGFKNILSSQKKDTEIIETIKFITNELESVLNGNYSLETNDFPGRFVLNMISDMILSKQLMGMRFDGEKYIENIFNACVVIADHL